MMAHPNHLPYSVNIRALAQFAESGWLYRAFDCLIAARNGQVLLMPPMFVTGSFSLVMDGCPVPWQEVVALKDDEEDHSFCLELAHMPMVKRMMLPLHALGLSDEWTFDFIGIHDPAIRNVLRFSHPCGARYGVVSPIKIK